MTKKNDIMPAFREIAETIYESSAYSPFSSKPLPDLLPREKEAYIAEFKQELRGYYESGVPADALLGYFVSQRVALGQGGSFAMPPNKRVESIKTDMYAALEQGAISEQLQAVCGNGEQYSGYTVYYNQPGAGAEITDLKLVADGCEADLKVQSILPLRQIAVDHTTLPDVRDLIVAGRNSHVVCRVYDEQVSGKPLAEVAAQRSQQEHPRQQQMDAIRNAVKSDTNITGDANVEANKAAAKEQVTEGR